MIKHTSCGKCQKRMSETWVTEDWHTGPVLCPPCTRKADKKEPSKSYLLPIMLNAIVLMMLASFGR